MSDQDSWPELGEFLVCTIGSVKQNGVYVDLDGYPGREGFIFIGEVASGWVKNIRSIVREGQRVVAKVIKVKKDKRSVELSIKSVSDERRRDTLQRWKNKQRAGQLLRIVGERSNWDEGKISEMSVELSETFGGLYAAFEETAIENDALKNEGFEGEWTAVFIETAVENIIPEFVNIRATADIQIHGSEGIEIIRKALSAAEDCASKEEEVEVSAYYDGAPEYRIELKAPDWDVAESHWDLVEAAISEHISAEVGKVEISRQ
ncbi:MAG TPA: translation initiation factor IF-2 subunit alpha [Candidatus Poseidoniales archaeon]|nr:MAG TPA: translation initiation factor IF-2 subunit alpha [Candidatus Poseidoniales archaeon]HIH80877.1 translation initiation factor IF-2 subunit alpha [Candidatus Thalassarchaeaceae archaeon]|tara:strand:+ start:1189 stop:1974 length:786 start_codon:yes stop_codon:yes gene_type:complete